MEIGGRVGRGHVPLGLGGGGEGGETECGDEGAKAGIHQRDPHKMVGRNGETKITLTKHLQNVNKMFK